MRTNFQKHYTLSRTQPKKLFGQRASIPVFYHPIIGPTTGGPTFINDQPIAQCAPSDRTNISNKAFRKPNHLRLSVIPTKTSSITSEDIKMASQQIEIEKLPSRERMRQES
jgi:hypothetical protein